MRLTHRTLVTALSLALLTLLFAVACESATETTGTLSPADTSLHSVEELHENHSVGVLISGFVYQNGSLDIASGTTVTWLNQDQIFHSVTTGAPGRPDGLIDGQMPNAGSSFVYTFESAGTFAYFCTRHTFMRGTITVR